MADPQPQSSTTVPQLALYQCDASGRCTYVNRSLCELFGISRDEALGAGWLSRVHPEDRERVQQSRALALSPIQTYYLEYRVQRGEETLWVAAFSTALMDGGNFVGRVGTITDITAARAPSD